MSIHKIGSDLVRPPGPKGSGPASRKPGSENPEQPTRRMRSDQVGFSAEGLALAELAKSAEHQASIEEIRARVSSGYYNDPAVADQVAERLLDSGDL